MRGGGGEGNGDGKGDRGEIVSLTAHRGFAGFLFQ